MALEVFDSDTRIFAVGGPSRIGFISNLGADRQSSDENSLLYWDVDAKCTWFGSQDERLVFNCYDDNDDNYSYASSSLSLESCSVEVLFDRRPTKLAGLRDKIRGSIKVVCV
ncbi:hypothetical protein K493DRAFT_295254 [Basidiobolus meristosporus CBS 931.73]|uniref:Uncharacterized protein n=1 Tax=Basidiobolus meristosporus CBS 931.73 TaxID=1314790 RepID=A0A1Y1ZCP1_9FUNG|nr:hypothetical protein K493DRAFT_295254 [Basidiobolus meristosporus CBS 931.73]|eukprot:ORY08018.1 hypothetical protein K493DRAFT_295254 [Basidiobolus meristosporus CBS 931.73]